MTILSFDLVTHVELARVSAAFGSGAHVVLGTERDGTGTLVQLAAGMTDPRTGRVTLDGRAPYAHADVRRRIASLCADERLPPARDVRRAFSTALRARGDARSASSVLDSAGLAHFAARRSADLSARHVRALALVLALTHPEPILLALFEPLALVDIVSADFVLQTLARAVDGGAVVLATASRVEDAARLDGAVSTLERGTWLDSAASRTPLSQITLRVHSPEARRLAARLSEAPDVSAVEWAGGRELLVRGNDLERVAAQVVRSARAAAIHIEAMRYDPPSLYALATARAALTQPLHEPPHVDVPAPASAQQPLALPPQEPQ